MSKAATEFTFNHKELVTLMLKNAEIHEGFWALSVNFTLGAGAFGPSEEKVSPSAFISVDSLSIRRASQPGPLTFDAAEVNPL